VEAPKDLRAVAAWETATRIVELLRWDREEQRAEAFVEILLVVEEGFERAISAHWQLFAQTLAAPGQN
jgi:hypothetical protein